ncbi:4-hydroxy-tetrahydrodipicolinate synthase [Sulfuricystis thermophila]|uniref:4-hydroxy-tetrahydrodipicolinate synthase n=1 Tax=Sulfuricystis thermophila TaxID=2496847 RepID=UPI0010362133|nr:4-hydroxy-tetrahydrodipicolinate synthase [Sulfuricystis thermophila]
MIRGSIPAIVTPMQEDGSLDLPALRRLLDWHIQEGSDAVVVVGTTGESPTVDMAEHCLLIRETVAHVAGRIPVIAGTGANSTTEAIELAQCAKAAGASAHLSVVPYYNKPTQEGLYQHFKAIAEEVDLPLILYNVPGRTVADLANETTLRLAQVPGIVGIKDATGNLERGIDLIKRAPAGFAIYSGDDATGLALVLMGGHGIITVTGNVAPRLMHEMVAAGLAGDVKSAREINLRLMGLHKQLFCEANPIPVKWACARMGLIKDALRLPLTTLPPEYHGRVRAAMLEAGIDL